MLGFPRLHVLCVCPACDGVWKKKIAKLVCKGMQDGDLQLVGKEGGHATLKFLDNILQVPIKASESASARLRHFRRTHHPADLLQYLCTAHGAHHLVHDTQAH